MALGPLMIDIDGVVLTDEDRSLLTHPQVGGVILFSRNYSGIEQLRELITEIHSLRQPRLLVAVDHEGGRVQRFREGFTVLPAAARFGEVFDSDRRKARQLAEAAGFVMASELHAVGIDFSFAPVLDIGRGISSVIGDRAFHRNAEGVAELATAYVAGMTRAGMAAVGKHFPGHGGVEADSHVAVPTDHRRLDEMNEDLLPFERLIHAGLAGIMPAHVIYAQIDQQSAGFSNFWLQQVLRARLGFKGIIFSDDLNMEGASVGGGYLQRAKQALDAGCDMILVCNNRPAAREVIEGLARAPDPQRQSRLARMHVRHHQSMAKLHLSADWQAATAVLAELGDDTAFHLVG